MLVLRLHSDNLNQSLNTNYKETSMKKNPVLSLAIALFAGLAQLTAQAEPFAYITDAGYDRVLVLDTATNNIVATLPTVRGTYGLSLTPDGSKAYAANYLGSVYIIDTATHVITGKIVVDLSAEIISIAPDGNRAYVTHPLSGLVSVIDLASNSVIAKIQTNTRVGGLGITPDSSKVYLASVDFVSVIDTATNSVLSTIPVGNAPYAVKVAPNGSRVYVTDLYSNLISVIDTANNTVTATIPLGGPSAGLAIAPDGKRLYATSYNGNTVSVIDPLSNSVIAVVPVGLNPIGAAVTPDGSRVYVGNYDDGTISIIDTATNSTLTTFPSSGYPWDIAITPVKPKATPTVTPAPNSNGWNNTNATINWNWTNAGGPGIDMTNCTKSSATAGEGTLALSAICKDTKGVIGKATYVVNVDKIAPTCTVKASVNSTQPKDEKQVIITANTTVSTGGSATSYKILSVTSTNKEGDKPNDVLSWTQTATGLVVKLGHDRKDDHIYSLTYQAYDLAGNTGNCSTTAVKIKK
jgi:YVTN family beta-propeller protein